MKINAFAIFFLSESRGLARLGALDPSLRLFWRVFFCRCACLFLCTGDLAVAETTHRFDVPAGRAVETLKLAARQGCVEIAFFAETVRGVQTPELHGDFATRDALARLVADTGLIVVSDRRDHTFIVRRAPSSPPAPLSPIDTPSVKSRSHFVTTVGAWLALAFAPTHSASAADEAKTEPITLTPFEVSTSKDRGYAAGNTLSGGRVDTPLEITPGSISVMTKEFMDDFNITNINDAGAWTIGFDLGTPVGSSNPSSISTYQVMFRGAPSDQNFPTRNGSINFGVADSYNTERFEFQRGRRLLASVSTVRG